MACPPDAYPGFLARRFQQIAVALFHAEVGAAGFDLTPVQYSALKALRAHPGIDQATLAGLIAFDRTTIGGVVDRLEQRGYLTRKVSARDRRARVLGELGGVEDHFFLEVDGARSPGDAAS